MGCGFDLSGLVGYIAKYIGWIMIIGGLIMTFYGANFVVWAITFLVFLFTVFTCFFFLVNIGIIKDPRISGSDDIPWLLIVLVIVCLVIGGIVAYFAKKLVERYTTLLLGACTGGLVLFFIMDKIDCAGYIKLLVTVLGVVAGGYLFNKGDRYIKAGTTSVIGSCLLF